MHRELTTRFTQAVHAACVCSVRTVSVAVPLCGRGQWGLPFCMCRDVGMMQAVSATTQGTYLPIFAVVLTVGVRYCAYYLPIM